MIIIVISVYSINPNIYKYAYKHGNNPIYLTQTIMITLLLKIIPTMFMKYETMK